MNYLAEPTADLRSEMQEIIEIKLWGLYLLSNSANLYREIIEFSLDNGPVEKNPQKPGRITFRFGIRDWEGRIKKLLYSHRIPVIVKSSSPPSFAFTKPRQRVA
jgi:hypothetical protein